MFRGRSHNCLTIVAAIFIAATFFISCIMAIPEWITIDKPSGTGNATVNITAATNDSAFREYPISVKGDSITKTIQCTQKGANMLMVWIGGPANDTYITGWLHLRLHTDIIDDNIFYGEGIKSDGSIVYVDHLQNVDLTNIEDRYTQFKCYFPPTPLEVSDFSDTYFLIHTQYSVNFTAIREDIFKHVSVLKIKSDLEDADFNFLKFRTLINNLYLKLTKVNWLNEFRTLQIDIPDIVELDKEDLQQLREQYMDVMLELSFDPITD